MYKYISWLTTPIVLFFYWIMRILLGNYSMRTKTWRQIKNNYKEIYVYKPKRNLYYFTIWINKTRIAYSVVIGCMALLTLLCHFDPFFNYSFIVLDFSTAKDILANGVENAGAIVGLSFVVITLLMEAVKNKTKYTSEEFFRLTYLNLVFAISICTILFYVIANLLSVTFNNDFIINLATLSCVFMILTIGSIAFMFHKVIKFFNKEEVRKVEKEGFIRSARFYRLEELFMKTSSQEYALFINKLPLNTIKDSDLIFETMFGTTENEMAPFSFKRDRYLVDINLFSLQRILSKIKNRFSENSINGNTNVNLNNAIFTNLFYLNKKAKIRKFQKSCIKLSFHTIKKGWLDGEYKVKRSELIARIYTAVENSDVRSLKGDIEYIRALKDITINYE